LAIIAAALVPLLAASCTSQERGSGATPQATSPPSPISQAPAGRTARGTGYRILPPEGADLAAIVAAGRDEIETKLRDSRLLGEAQEVDVGGAPGLSCEYTHTAQRKPLYVRQVIAVRDGNAYTITFTAHEQAFSSDVPAFDQILSGWSWT
jgi:hypothetical protein